MRAGGLDYDRAVGIVLGLAVAYFVYRNRVTGFQPPLHYPPRNEWCNLNDNRPPHLGKYGSSSTSLGLDGKEYLSSRNWLRKAYEQLPSADVNIKGFSTQEIPPWSVAKHIYHAPDFGLKPEKYGMTLGDLESIRRNGLVKHVKSGGRYPSKEFVRDLQHSWKVFSENPKVEVLSKGQKLMGQNAIILKHQTTGLFVGYDLNTNKCVTGYLLSALQSRKHNLTGIIGKTYCFAIRPRLRYLDFYSSVKPKNHEKECGKT